MAWHDDDREERREYEADVFYDVWRSGRDPDRINHDRVEDHFYNGDDSSHAADHEIRLQREAEQRRREEIEQQEYNEYQEYCWREQEQYEIQERENQTEPEQ